MEESDEVPQLIHGVLEVNIFEAVRLHHLLHGTIIKVEESIEKALHLHALHHRKLYATVDIGIARLARTREVEFHSTNPKWNETFKLYCAHSSSSIHISIKDQLLVAGKVVGRARIPIRGVLESKLVEGWFDLYDDDGHRVKEAQIRVSLKFFEAASGPLWNSGIRLPEYAGIPNSYFPERTGCDVTLYQNSHLSSSFQPRIHLDGHKFYRPRRLWEDLYISISEAKHFVYVAGWSVNVNITLIRDPERMIHGAAGVSIGELLKRKADDGVLVLVMVWQDRTSVSLLGNAGLMKTHDEETLNFFEGSKVKCFLCPRNADPSLTAVQHIEVDAEFTHHQKTVSLDIAEPGSSHCRRVASFIGGIDLSDGRYDDEKHTLFGKLDTAYVNDFLQHNFPDASLRLGGPREPWHDLHSKLEGPAAWDVLTNFEQRWKLQSPKELSNCLLNIQDKPDVFPLPSNLTTAESWNVQVFRSIDDSSVLGFPSNLVEASRMGLTNGKNITIDQSIHSGYIEAIRRAKRFIYIENQYFMGSSASWKQDQDNGCLNLVPIEIALKIASKIKMGERFAAYIVTPMWPEGIPEGSVVQAILHWYRLTMDLMYGIVAAAIKEAGLAGKTHPTDYLNFFCLGNRETKQPGEYEPPERPETETDYWKAQVNRRFLIYVHAKLMIVDDEYVIIGSANINQRSLAGDRDSEIAHGSYQPAHLNSEKRLARGLVHGFRMSLWYEHFISHNSGLHHVFLEPESLECVRTVRSITENLWEKYVGDEVVNLPGHLLPFPVRVSADGVLSELTPDGCFPDTKASIKGDGSVISLAIPPILTT
ncbi:phospholipase D alpha 1-like [Phalaenopsis equestris]|uniref:phospholipase D alpha 1-like n=1 Tax=Phalaenopsis equestris TaxID=78828 RepID=UPI0009E34CF2|nr:phospholipase D alpha 1-like [Phalaenopsis equestris]